MKITIPTKYQRFQFSLKTKIILGIVALFLFTLVIICFTFQYIATVANFKVGLQSPLVFRSILSIQQPQPKIIMVATTSAQKK